MTDLSLDFDECQLVGINTELFKPRLQQISVSTPSPPPPPPPPPRPIEPPQPSQPSPPLTPPPQAQVKPDPTYNLRSSKPVKRVVFASTTRWIPKKSKTCFRDVILSSIDTAKYHSFISDVQARNLIDLANTTISSQIDHFVHDSRTYIVISWLTTARIFEYDKAKNLFLEVKRMPDRFVKVSSNIITSVHYSDSRFYIAYLWANPNDNHTDKTKPYIEVRDVHGKLLLTPMYYDHAIKNIYSDSKYIYAINGHNNIFIHRKKLFNCAYYQVDFSTFTSNPIIKSYVQSTITDSYTRMRLLSATTKELLVSFYDSFSHNIVQCYRFDGNYEIVSMNKIDQLIIIHRKLNDPESKHRSVLDFGFMARIAPSDEKLFIHESAIYFNYIILQVRLWNDNLYVFGHDGTSSNPFNFQLGCIYLPSLKPVWITNLNNANIDSHILPHSDNITVINRCQTITTIKIGKTKRKIECKKCQLSFICEKDRSRHEKGEQTILSKIVVVKNKYLEEVGASIFKKLPPLDDPNSFGENDYSSRETCC